MKQVYTPKIICIDIDGTIVKYQEFVDDKTFGDLIPGSVDALKKLATDHWFIVIYSTRANKDEIANFLDMNNIPYHAINEHPYQPDNAKGGKPIADIYVDDRSIQFKGNWNETLDEINSFKPWEKRDSYTITNEDNLYANSMMEADFTQAYYMLRHYDKENWDITKFCFSQILIAAGASWTIFSLSKSETSFITEKEALLVILLICVASLAFSILSMSMIWKYRNYFCKASHYLNEHRKLFLDKQKVGFMNNSNYYTDYKQPLTFHWNSSQMYCFYLLLLLCIGLGIIAVILTRKLIGM